MPNIESVGHRIGFDIEIQIERFIVNVLARDQPVD